jgi:hypothetical protein
MIQFFFFKRKWKQKKFFRQFFQPFNNYSERHAAVCSAVAEGFSGLWLSDVQTKERGECAALLFVTLKGRSEIT